MKISGGSMVASVMQTGGQRNFCAVNPATGEQLSPVFFEATAAQVNMAVEAAEQDFNQYRRLSLDKRAEFLVAIAAQLRSLEAELVARARLETGLSQLRLEGELTRTVNQLLSFADFVRKGGFLQTRIDPALPDRQPLPRPDIRMTQVPIGPLAVFGASNFPFAFSVAGGDTASALAAGCSVIAKGHPAHPGTCELAGQAIVRALADCALPPGVFSLLQGTRHGLGAELVQHPLLRAVAFTGSQAGGRALFDLAAARAEPIPVFAEMGSVNPVFMLPQALRDGGEKLVGAYADSVELGVGQFCTKPGLLFGLNSLELEKFVSRLEEHQSQAAPGVMLHAGIKQNYRAALETLAQRPGVELLCRQPVELSDSADCRVTPALLLTTAERFLCDPQVSEEIFGPAAVIVACGSRSQLLDCAAALNGQLTATVHAANGEEGLARELFAILERKAGRLILNGFPTGVEVCHAMVHGGPYPAATDSRTTSVGIAAMQRFLRPVCLQNIPPSFLPAELQN